MSALLYKKIDVEITKAQTVLLLTDERIDGDTVGAALGMYHILRAMGKTVHIYSPKPIPQSFGFLPAVENISRDETIFDTHEIDLVLIFDCADGQYIEPLMPRLPKSVPLVVIDHHVTNPRYGTINLIEEESASAAGVVWRFVKAMRYPVNKEAAQCILTGICTDTNLFLTTSTTSACLSAAHELSYYGAHLQQIVHETMMNKSIPALKLWGIALERLHKNQEFDAIATVITRKDLEETQAEPEDLQGLINFLNAMIEGADTILVYAENEDGSVKGSLRSVTKDVAKMAEVYGGGGHIRAAGFKIPHSRLEEKDGAWFVKKEKHSVEKS